MTTSTFTVNGMKCNNCKARVEEALKSINGVENANASLEEKQVTITYNEGDVAPQAFKEAVEGSGRFELEL